MQQAAVDGASSTERSEVAVEGAGKTLERLIDSSLQQSDAAASNTWEPALSAIISFYVIELLPYQLLAYCPAVKACTTFATLPELLSDLHSRRGLPPVTQAEQAQDSTEAVAVTVEEMEEQVRVRLLHGRVYKDDAWCGDYEKDSDYSESELTKEWAVLQGERLTVQEQQLVEASSSPPTPLTAFVYPVAVYLLDPGSMASKPHHRGSVEVLMFYEAPQLSVHLRLHYEPLPPSDDDPVPRLWRMMQTCDWEESSSAVIQAARRVDCTAAEEQRVRRQWQQLWEGMRREHRGQTIMTHAMWC